MQGKSIFFTLYGVLLCILWFIPSFISKDDLFFYQSYYEFFKASRACILMPLAPFAVKNIIEIYKHSFLTRYVAFLFIVFPLFSVCLAANINFIYRVYLPYSISGISILICITLSNLNFKYLMHGVSLCGVTLFVLLFINYGFGYSDVFGRARASFGMNHPTQSAALLLTSCYFIYFLFSNSLYRGLIFIIFGYLLTATSSKNNLIAFLIFFIFLSVYSFISERWKLVIGIFFILAPYLFFIYSFSGDIQSYFYEILNQYSSNRMKIYFELIPLIFSDNYFNLLFGANNSIGEYSDIIGWATSDSVYVTILSNYGLISLLLFSLLFFFLLIKSLRSNNTIVFSLLCALTFFYTFDSQGLSFANPPIFFAFIYLLRLAIDSNFDLKHSSSSAI
jgi:hypothetical protein